ncbi:MAG: hypothetical protein PF518_13425 [Spirochaetaceae bacterium]|nr:hypothetical protein [Spirochaetaceae bacterium]
MTAILIFSCSSTPEQITTIPGWFSNPPSDNNQFVYFTVSEKVQNTEDIESKAGETLFFDILDFVGISENDSKLQDLGEFRNELINFVKGSPLPGFKLIEKKIDDMGSDSVIYILVELERERLDLIENDLEDILKAGLTASIFSTDAEEFVKNGDLYNGVLSYIKAAIESAESDNNFITGKNLTDATDLLKNIKLVKIESPQTIAVGEKAVFSAALMQKDEVAEAKWSKISVKVNFRDRKKGSVINDRFALLRTDDKGIVTFVHPSPGFTGSGRVDITLDLFRDTGSLELFEENYSDKLDELKAAVEGIKVTFDFKIVSSAPTIPTGILIVDSDFLRKPLLTISTAEGLKNYLSEAGFNVSILNIDRDKLLNFSEKEFLRDIVYLVDPDIRRVIFGVARITEFDDSVAGFTVVTEADLKVIDLDSGEILFSESLNKRVQGGESQSTINTSFKELGKSFSSILVDKLP